MTDQDKRELAEEHWRYTEGLLKSMGKLPTNLEHYLYIEAFCHGIKHGKEK
jgi:hypothetical protein